LIKSELRKIEYDIIKGESYHNFYAVVFSAWNRLALLNYLNLLVGERCRNFEIYVDGNFWNVDDAAININRVRIKAYARKRNIKAKGLRWVASKEELELWSINIRRNDYCKFLSIWSKVTLEYALDIWREFTKKFPNYDWILYNNKKLKKCDLHEDVFNYKYYGSMYLKTSLKGGGKFDAIINVINSVEMVDPDKRDIKLLTGLADTNWENKLIIKTAVEDFGAILMKERWNYRIIYLNRGHPEEWLKERKLCNWKKFVEERRFEVMIELKELLRKAVKVNPLIWYLLTEDYVEALSQIIIALILIFNF
jgi:hypothetical protein